ncbi:FliI/YscN family ATPase [Thermanaerothrix sp. 4228-RoL]|uniref:FliI/YscN family ATPase n=1 Tax=Thermanaerothrix solaris TaxID=3058434 RepID=A0ABU3NLH3_9CHLR|nr:FliI/YscN family ATPase [Thermanaerothrix sp. 4228-RoL]MDT8897682.1 FliI/YscN family ATPase [Thermanaerothrix sp. 4228-RoL]
MNSTLKALNPERYLSALQRANPFQVSGRIVQVVGLTIEAVGIDCQIGEICEMRAQGAEPVLAEVVGFRDERILLMPLGAMDGIQPGSEVYPISKSFRVPVGMALLGRVLDGLGRPMDGGPALTLSETVATNRLAPNPMQRKPITEPLVTGVRAIDGLLTMGKGQRMGIFAGSGVGKSTLLGTLARRARADVSVIALVGERGREVREFLDRDLGSEGLQRAVVVVSTSDQPALVRLKAAFVAMTIAEYFRDLGLDVIFLMDSVTRFAMAQREVGLAIGEPPASKGYTPSVFALLPRLLERAGCGERGTITGFFTVLVEGDDFNEPICDAVRGILDGHIILSRVLAARNHYPAIDVLNSISRLMPSITTPDHRSFAAQLRKHLAVYEKARDLINIGAYVAGSDPEIDAAIAVMPALERFLQQDVEEFTPFESTLNQMAAMIQGVNHAA